MALVPIELAGVDHAQGDEVDAYERLLSDAMSGHPLFLCARTPVDAPWAVVQQVLGNVSRAHVYDPGPGNRAEADSLAADIGSWMT
jgi:glucose-6-phosphate 1-dehydrogenase